MVRCGWTFTVDKRAHYCRDETLFSIIRLFDSNIQRFQMVDEHNYRVSICDVERVLSDKELLHMLSSGTTKGIILYTLVAASL